MEAPSLPMAIPTQPNAPPRPTGRDPAIRREGARAALPELRRWLKDDKTTDDDLLDDLVSVMGLHDGYERAREFERRLGYSPDEDLVEILGNLNCWRAERAAVAAWVEANGIRPVYPHGYRVVWTRNGGKAGCISSIDEAQGTYAVLLDENLDQAAKKGIGHIGYTVVFEDVTAELWCCHIKGPDDVIACDDHLHAVRLAKLINESAGKHAAELDVMFEACAAVWPHSAEAHARSLGEPSVDYARALVATRVTNAMRDIMLERRRQMVAEGWDPSHDDEHGDGSLLRAAVLYFHHATKFEGLTYQGVDGPPTGWPWERHWWKPKAPRRDLVRAGALCLAEEERLQRAGARTGHVIQKLGLIVDALEAIDAGGAAA